jgi:hypothetical protein
MVHACQASKKTSAIVWNSRFNVLILQLKISKQDTMITKHKTIRLDNNVMSALSARAMSERQSIEAYANKLLRLVLNIDSQEPEVEKSTAEKRLACIEQLCGVLHDDGVDYKVTREDIMNERYGEI